MIKNYRILSRTIRQPINHHDANGAYFEQRVKILIPNKATAEPVVFLILGNEIAISDGLYQRPVKQFIGSLKLLDVIFAKGPAGKYCWRVWRYQQFNETGALWAAAKEGLYRNDSDDWGNECKLLFGEAPPLLKKNTWNVEDMVNGLRIPLVYVNGGKDPWKGVCLPRDHIIKNGSYVYFENSFHCPDQEDANGIEVINELVKFINQ